MTRTKLRASLTEQAAQLVEKEACYVCRKATEKLPGHADCWRFVNLAREIRKLGQAKEAP
jgi:hypothetical protein